jgi:hypothetical protein
MARNGSGSFDRPVSDYVPDTDILAEDVNAEFDDIATALTDSIAKDGQTTPTANLPMGGFRHTGAGNASARNHYAAAGQVQDGAFLWGGTAAGTADARTIAPTPAITAYAAGQIFRFINGAAANTGAATLAVSGLTATAIRKGVAATELAAGDLPADAAVEVLFDGTVFRLMAVQPAGIGVQVLRAADPAGMGAVALAGGTMTGPLSTAGSVNVYGAAETERFVQWSSNAEVRWRLIAESTAESGANAGTNFGLVAFDDDEVAIGEVFVVTRSTRVTDFKVQPTLNGVALSTTTGTITGVTAGLGLTGGGASGAVTLDVSGTYGGVGTYMWAENNSGGTITPGSTTAGSGLVPSQSGTWRLMGGPVGGTAVGASGLWFRTV